MRATVSHQNIPPHSSAACVFLCVRKLALPVDGVGHRRGDHLWSVWSVNSPSSVVVLICVCLRVHVCVCVCVCVFEFVSVCGCVCERNEGAGPLVVISACFLITPTAEEVVYDVQLWVHVGPCREIAGADESRVVLYERVRE